MWLPTPIYRRIPQVWFLMGLLFIANGLYLGVGFAISKVCLAAGLTCCAVGTLVAIVRMRAPQGESESDSSLASTE